MALPLARAVVIRMSISTLTSSQSRSIWGIIDGFYLCVCVLVFRGEGGGGSLLFALLKFYY